MATKTITERIQQVTKAREAEKQATKQEQEKAHKPISPKLYNKVKHVHELQTKIKEMQAEIEVVRIEAFAEMDRKEVDQLTRNGVPVVQRDHSSSRSCDYDELEKDFPEIYPLYVTQKLIDKINWLKPRI